MPDTESEPREPPYGQEDVADSAPGSERDGRGDPQIDEVVLVGPDGHLVLWDQPAAYPSRQPDGARALLTLLSPPSEAQLAEGLLSAVPARTALVAVTSDGRGSVVELSQEFAAESDGGGPEQATLQVACTVGLAEGAASVEVAVEGKTVAVHDLSDCPSR